MSGRVDARNTLITSARRVRITQFIRRVPLAYRLNVGTVTRRRVASTVSSTIVNASPKMTWAVVGSARASRGTEPGTLEVEMGVNTVTDYGTGGRTSRHGAVAGDPIIDHSTGKLTGRSSPVTITARRG